jgi:hypothetical protein
VVVSASQLLSGRDPKAIADELIGYRGTAAAALSAMVEGLGHGDAGGSIVPLDVV